jgi:Domain of unknown function (DUF4347)
MATVWAPYVGSFNRDPSSGWSDTVYFKSLNDLCLQLTKNKLGGQVTKLAIIAHGNESGLVQLDRALRPGTLSSFSEDLGKLGEFLQPDAMLMFMSCLAGAGDEGTDLLIGISSILKSRYIIGFLTIGILPSWTGRPGQILEGDEGGVLGAGAFKDSGKMINGRKPLTEQSIFAKWARNGELVRLPVDEQIKRKGYRCAWKACPGHQSPMDRCVPHVP